MPRPKPRSTGSFARPSPIRSDRNSWPRRPAALPCDTWPGAPPRRRQGAAPADRRTGDESGSFGIASARAHGEPLYAEPLLEFHDIDDAAAMGAVTDLAVAVPGFDFEHHAL